VAQLTAATGFDLGPYLRARATTWNDSTSKVTALPSIITDLLTAMQNIPLSSLKLFLKVEMFITDQNVFYVLGETLNLHPNSNRTEDCLQETMSLFSPVLAHVWVAEDWDVTQQKMQVRNRDFKLSIT
jgi:hypothetical protein